MADKELGHSYAWVERAVRPFAARLVKAGIAANAVTAAGLAVCLASAALILSGAALYLAAPVFLLGSIADLFDGPVARMRTTASRVGGLFDCYADHLGEAVFVGALVLTLPDSTARLAAGAGMSSLAASYVKPLAAEYGVRGIDWRTAHVFGRAGRVLILTAGLTSTIFAGQQATAYALAALIAFNALSITHRIVLTMRAARRTELEVQDAFSDDGAFVGAGPR